jgi:hypothetical protein
LSFVIAAGGSKEKVLEKLKASTGYGDPQHHDALRDALVKVVEGAPDDAVVMVEASGHHDFSGTGQPRGYATLTFKIF